MDRNKINAYLCAILTTLLETEAKHPMPAPQTPFYLALGLDLGLWELLRNLLQDGGLVACTTETIQLTPKGRDVARDANALVS